MAVRSKEVDATFAALDHEVRRHIVMLLSHRGGELSSGHLAQRFTHSWPATTRHLRVLEAAGIVSVRREGRSCMYRLEREHLQRVVTGWLALLEPPTSTQTWRSRGRRSIMKEAVS